MIPDWPAWVHVLIVYAIWGTGWALIAYATRPTR